MEETKPIPAAELFCIHANTLLGSGLFFLPSLLAKSAHNGGWLVWLALLPASLGLTWLLCAGTRLIPQRPAGVLRRAARLLYAAVLLLLCALSLAGMSALVGRLLLPATPTVVILLLLCVPLWYVLPFGVRAIARLNTVMTLCFLLLFFCFLLSAVDFDPSHLARCTAVADWPAPGRALLWGCAGLAGLLPLPVYYAAAGGRRTAAALNASATAAVGHSAVNLLCVGVLGAPVAAAADLPVLLTLQYGEFAFFPKLFFTALFFNLLLIKPAINCGYAGFSCLQKALPGRRPRVLAAFFVLAVLLSASGLLALIRPFT